jgi:hypothetical protein
MRRKVLILFDGPHLAYSPTVIGLYDLLSEKFDVTIIAAHPETFNNQKLPGRKVLYTKLKFKRINRLYKLWFHLNPISAKTIQYFKKLKLDYREYFYYFSFIKKAIRKLKPDVIIAVDFRQLFFTELLNKKVEFLSLELSDNIYKAECKYNKINSVIIQSRERLDYVFPGNKKPSKVFFVQNAPVFKELEINNSERRGLVYCGTAWDHFGFYHCLNFLKEYSNYSMTVKGAIRKDDLMRVKKEYPELIQDKRLVIDDIYSDDKEVVNYLTKFRIGFCFYNFLIKEIDTFNYHSAPSGKLFKYLAAGVPVIGIDIPGFGIIKEFNCGVLIKSLDPLTIKTAIEKIESNFDYYSFNCLRVAKEYSFDKTTRPFLEYLETV